MSEKRRREKRLHGPSMSCGAIALGGALLLAFFCLSFVGFTRFKHKEEHNNTRHRITKRRRRRRRRRRKEGVQHYLNASSSSSTLHVAMPRRVTKKTHRASSQRSKREIPRNGTRRHFHSLKTTIP